MTSVAGRFLPRRAAGHGAIGDSIRTLQLQEKEQLRLVRLHWPPPVASCVCVLPLPLVDAFVCLQEATLQVLRKEHARGAWPWQRGEVPAQVRFAGGAQWPQQIHPSVSSACCANVMLYLLFQALEADEGVEGNGSNGDGPLRAPWATAGACRGAAEHAGNSCGCGKAPTEPTEEEYTGAVSEVRVAQQATVTAINDILDELRQAVADVLENA